MIPAKSIGCLKSLKIVRHFFLGIATPAFLSRLDTSGLPRYHLTKAKVASNNMSESFSLSSFQHLSERTRLVEVLETLKNALKARPKTLDEHIASLIDHLIGIITAQSHEKPEAETITEIGEFGSHLLEKLYFETLQDAEQQQMFNKNPSKYAIQNKQAGSGTR